MEINDKLLTSYLNPEAFVSWTSTQHRGYLARVQSLILNAHIAHQNGLIIDLTDAVIRSIKVLVSCTYPVPRPRQCKWILCIASVLDLVPINVYIC